MKLKTGQLRLKQAQHYFKKRSIRGTHGSIDSAHYESMVSIGAFIKYQKDIMALRHVMCELSGPYASGESKTVNPHFSADAIQYLDDKILLMVGEEEKLVDEKGVSMIDCGGIHKRADYLARNLSARYDITIELKRKIKESTSTLEALAEYRNDLLL